MRKKERFMILGKGIEDPRHNCFSSVETTSTYRGYYAKINDDRHLDVLLDLE